MSGIPLFLLGNKNFNSGDQSKRPRVDSRGGERKVPNHLVIIQVGRLAFAMISQYDQTLKALSFHEAVVCSITREREGRERKGVRKNIALVQTVSRAAASKLNVLWMARETCVMAAG